MGSRRGVQDHEAGAPLCSPFKLGEVVVDPTRNRIVHRDEAFCVQPKTIALACLLASEPGRTFTRNELIEEVWDGVVVGSAAIDRCVCNLRKALGDDARCPRFVETIRKRGVRLMVDVELVSVAKIDTKKARARSVWPFAGAAAAVPIMLTAALKLVGPDAGPTPVVEAEPQTLVQPAALRAGLDVVGAMCAREGLSFGGLVRLDDFLHRG
ncbi:winged helix-turn-helix domain-containing protein [Parvularcula dongshanensis]|uniref:DNA-binding winged helix-turn-helix (WHTH) protein n=1 Tax=Parvularcula dongshanensis TaxID=1173995 RepID=A0A840I4X8_9PROT|nr:winged helix-turn-helix domain-containing protein [Parvularcula dongshanensis]MBB4659385.1 DNA-binding winged helix-turn-helix (wHTH) protein [Parvularcula dongshanensis]